MKLLVVEDDPPLQAARLRWLSPSGYRCDLQRETGPGLTKTSAGSSVELQDVLPWSRTRAES